MHVFTHTISKPNHLYLKWYFYCIFPKVGGNSGILIKESTMLWEHSFGYILKISFLRKIGTDF